MGGWCWKLVYTDSDTERSDKPSRITPKDIAMLNLKARRKDVEHYLKRINQKINESLESARKYSKSDKTRALYSLKLRKMYESRKNEVLGMLHLLETSILSIEQAQIDTEVHEALKTGEKALKEVRSKINVKDFEDIYDSVQEQNQLTEFLGNTLVDEQELLERLDKLEEAEEEKATDKEFEARINMEGLKAPQEELKVDKKKEVKEEEVENKELQWVLA